VAAAALLRLRVPPSKLTAGLAMCQQQVLRHAQSISSGVEALLAGKRVGKVATARQELAAGLGCEGSAALDAELRRIKCALNSGSADVAQAAMLELRAAQLKHSLAQAEPDAAFNVAGGAWVLPRVLASCPGVAVNGLLEQLAATHPPLEHRMAALAAAATRPGMLERAAAPPLLVGGSYCASTSAADRIGAAQLAQYQAAQGTPLGYPSLWKGGVAAAKRVACMAGQGALGALPSMIWWWLDRV
jgi:hypothetical protein